MSAAWGPDRAFALAILCVVGTLWLSAFSATSVRAQEPPRQNGVVVILGVRFAFYITEYSCGGSTYPKAIYAYNYANADSVINRAARNPTFRSLRLTEEEKGNLTKLAQRWNILGYNLGSVLLRCDFKALRDTAEQLVVTARAVEEFLNGVVKLRDLQAKSAPSQPDGMPKECKKLLESSAAFDGLRGYVDVPKDPKQLPGAVVEGAVGEATGVAPSPNELTRLNGAQCALWQTNFRSMQDPDGYLRRMKTLYGKQ